MFLGQYSFFGGAYAVSYMATNAIDEDYLSISSAKYDDLYMTPNTSGDATATPPEDWTDDTLIHATYDSGLGGGNFEHETEGIDAIIVKRREVLSDEDKAAGKPENQWQTLYVHDVSESTDQRFAGIDTFAGAKRTYEYALVPVYQGVENQYFVTEPFKSDFDGMFVVGAEDILVLKSDETENTLNPSNVFGTELAAKIDVTRNAPSAVVELINHKYPKWVSNSIANYDSGTASGEFLKFIDCSKGMEALLDIGWEYRRDFMDFLTDKKPKILKYETGAMWLINVTGAPTNNSYGDNLIKRRTISFEWVQIGDHESDKDMYNAGLSNVDSKYWRT